MCSEAKASGLLVKEGLGLVLKVLI
jgi:hypothetical protein